MLGIVLGVLAAYIFSAYVLTGFNLRNRWRLRHIPGPKPAFWAGSLNERPPGKIHYSLISWPRKYGPVMKYFFGRTPYVLISDAKLVEEVATRKFKIFHDRPVLPTGITITKEDSERRKNEILWAQGNLWASVRAGCEPLFHTKNLQSYAPVMHDSIDELLENLDANSAGNASFDVMDSLQKMALTIVGRAAFGVEFYKKGEKNALVDAANFILTPPKRVSMYLYLNLVLPALRPLLNFLVMKGYYRNEHVEGVVSSIAYLIGTSKVLLANACKTEVKAGATGTGSVTDTTQLLELPPDYKRMSPIQKANAEGQLAGASTYKHATPAPDSFFYKLLHANVREEGQAKPLTELQIAAQGYIFILAGQDTTANALSATLYQLARNSEAQKRVIEEVDAICPDGQPQFEDVADFQYIEAAFQEALRLCQPVNPMFVTCRVAGQDTTVGGYKIPKGTTVVMNSLGMAMDDKYFPEHKLYKPERFIDGTPRIGPETRPAAAHIPFGYGPHGCIGRRFALEEAIFALVRIFQKYTISLDDQHHPPGSRWETRTGTTLASEVGVWVKLQPRKGIGKAS